MASALWTSRRAQGFVAVGEGAYLDSRQVAGLLGICVRTLGNFRQRQIVPFIQIGRLIRYRRDAVESAFSLHSVGSQPDAGIHRSNLEYSRRMRRRSKDWPRVYTRKYPTGVVRYGVDLGKQGSKVRDRRLFDTQRERDEFVREARAACEQQGQVPFFLPHDAQSQAVKLYEYLKKHGISFDDVRRHYTEDVIPYLTTPKVPEIAAQLVAKVEKKYQRRRRTDWPDKLRCFFKEFSGVFSGKITDIKEDELEVFCFRGDEPTTERARRAMVAQLFNFAIKKGWAKVNLANNLDIPELAVKEPEFLTVEEVGRLLSVATEFGLLGFFALGLFLGIRPEELQKLLWSDIHIDDGRVVIYAAAAKISQRRELPINATLAAWLTLCARDSGTVVDPTNFQDRYESCRAAAGLLDDWCPDVVRHTFATYHAAAFKNLNETARLMGHIGGLRVLKKHYMAYIPERTAQEFWALRPAIFQTTGAPGAVTESSPRKP